MATFAERVATACEPIGNSTYQTNVDSAVDTFKAAIYAEVVTGAGRGATSAQWQAIEDAMINLTRLVASELADTT